MICDKCGKSNISDASQCSYCGEKMPDRTRCVGFADILSFAGQVEQRPIQMQQPINNDNTKQEGVSEEEMQKLFKKTDKIIKSTQKNTFFGFIAILLSLLIFITSIIVGVSTVSSVREYKEETMKQITETQKEIEEYKAQVDKLLESSAQ